MTTMTKAMFTPEELAEIAAYDAEIDMEFVIKPEEIAESRLRDREAALSEKSCKEKKVAAYQREYYAANREKVAAKRGAKGGST